MQLWLRDPLAYPAGRAPGFDPTHVAARGLVYSGVAVNDGLVFLLSGTPATVVGTAAGAIDGALGPSVNNSGSSSNYWRSPAPSAVVPSTLTFAAIVRLPSTLSGYAGISGWGAVNGLSVQYYSPGLAVVLIEYGPGNNANSSSFKLSLGRAYFIAGSVDNTLTVNYVAVDLLTGEIFESSGANTGNPQGGTGSAYFYVANWYAGSEDFAGNVAAVMISGDYMSMPALLQWAQRPWDFWYPPTVDEMLFAEMVGAIASGQGYSFSMTVGSYSSTGDVITPAVRALSSPGTYALSGNAIKAVITALFSAGSYIVTGVSDAWVVLIKTLAAAGSYAITGASSILSGVLVFISAAGSYVITGISTLLAQGLAFVAIAGSYAITGASALFKFSALAAAGSYSLTGIAATLVISAATSGLNMIASAGSYILSGVGLHQDKIPPAPTFIRNSGPMLYK